MLLWILNGLCKCDNSNGVGRVCVHQFTCSASWARCWSWLACKKLHLVSLHSARRILRRIVTPCSLCDRNCHSCLTPTSIPVCVTYFHTAIKMHFEFLCRTTVDELIAYTAEKMHYWLTTNVHNTSNQSSPFTVIHWSSFFNVVWFEVFTTALPGCQWADKRLGNPPQGTTFYGQRQGWKTSRVLWGLLQLVGVCWTLQLGACSVSNICYQNWSKSKP